MESPVIAAYYFEEELSPELRSPSSRGAWKALSTMPGPFHDGFSFLVTLALLSFPFGVYYLVELALYHAAHRHSKDRRQVPPDFPRLIPYVGNVFGLIFTPAKLITTATKYGKSLVPARLALPVGELILIQGMENIAALWHSRDMDSPIASYTFYLSNMFGLPRQALSVYKADDSGSHARPRPGTPYVSPKDRIDFLVHQSLHKTFDGPNLDPTFARAAALFRRNLASSLGKDPLGQGDGGAAWGPTQPDFLVFFRDQLRGAIIEALCGPSLFKLHPDFLRDFEIFDDAIVRFAKMTPRFLMPGPYRARDRLIAAIKRWHSHAREHFNESSVGPDGDQDPFWGSELFRSRQRDLGGIMGDDDDFLPAADLGLIWASVTNLVPSALMCALHIFHFPKLADRVRASLNSGGVTAVSPETWDVDMDRVLSSPLLSSVYAENLRLHARVFITRCSRHADVRLGRSWLVPRNQMCVVPTEPSHMDPDFWNTRGGEFPLDTFWPERFLIYPGDPSSGPVRSDVSPKVYTRPVAVATAQTPSPSAVGGQNKDGVATDHNHDHDHNHEQSKQAAEETKNKGEPFFSTRGLGAAWIPYGGGSGACPGRHFAKRVAMFTAALLVTVFDVQIVGETGKDIEMSDARYGLGIQTPKHRIPFRIRKRVSC